MSVELSQTRDPEAGVTQVILTFEDDDLEVARALTQVQAWPADLDGPAHLGAILAAMENLARRIEEAGAQPAAALQPGEEAGP